MREFRENYSPTAPCGPCVVAKLAMGGVTLAAMMWLIAESLIQLAG